MGMVRSVIAARFENPDFPHLLLLYYITNNAAGTTTGTYSNAIVNLVQYR